MLDVACAKVRMKSVVNLHGTDLLFTFGIITGVSTTFKLSGSDTDLKLLRERLNLRSHLAYVPELRDGIEDLLGSWGC